MYSLKLPGNSPLLQQK